MSMSIHTALRSDMLFTVEQVRCLIEIKLGPASAEGRYTCHWHLRPVPTTPMCNELRLFVSVDGVVSVEWGYGQWFGFEPVIGLQRLIDAAAAQGVERMISRARTVARGV